MLAILVPLPGLSQVGKGCPWLNIATATSVLKSDEKSPTASLVQGSPGLCSFDYRDAMASRELRITVEQAQDPDQVMKAREGPCRSSASPLQAIGNEAVSCTVSGEGSTSGELIIGRVRDQIFTVRLTTDGRNDPAMVTEAIEDKAHSIAEQIAGALF